MAQSGIKRIPLTHSERALAILQRHLNSASAFLPKVAISGLFLWEPYFAISSVEINQEKAVRDLSQSLRMIPNSISDFSESVQALQSIQEQINTLRDNYQQLGKNQQLIFKEVKLEVS